jgi:hypothetical protein
MSKESDTNDTTNTTNDVVNDTTNDLLQTSVSSNKDVLHTLNFLNGNKTNNNTNTTNSRHPQTMTDTGIFRKPDPTVKTDNYKGGSLRNRQIKTDVYVDFSTMSSENNMTENNLSDANSFVGKISKISSKSTILDTSKNTDKDVMSEFLNQNSQSLGANVKKINFVPKGHHVYKSRKIELVTPEDKK